MSKCVAAGMPAGVFVCVLFSVASAALAQDSAPSPEAIPAEPAATTSEDGTPLPKVVVTTPKEKKKSSAKKVSGKSAGGGSSDGGATGEAAKQDAGGVGGAVDSEVVVDGVLLGGPATSDTGTSVFDSRNVRMRTDGSGDANTFLRNLPNVQYQNDIDADPGVDGQDEINTKPLLLSINGGRTYENNFILNGVSINNITGPVEANEPKLGDEELTPNQYAVFGLHPQQIFVPSEFLSQATVIDSNASAEYGEFQGGVVIYDLAKPPTDRYRTSITYSRHTDEMVNYILGTEDGENPTNRKHPTFEKNNLAVSIGAPITNDFSFIAQASHKTAETSKQKAYYISDDFTDEDSENNFFRVAATLRTDIGKFTLDSSFTDYTQHWENMFGRDDLYIDTASQGSSTQLEYLGKLPGVEVAALGLGRVTLKSRVYYNESETTNTSGDNVTFNWANQSLSGYNPATGWGVVYDTTLHDDWCRGVDPATHPSNGTRTISCREGGYGNKLQGQNDLGVQAHLNGDILLGNFKVGAEAKQIEGRRARFEDYYFVATNTVATSSNSPGYFICPENDRFCTSEQYVKNVSLFEAHDVSAVVNAFHTYAEIDQSWQWLNVRAGVRVDYEDYLKNINVAPRLAGTVTPWPGLSFTGGFNRYYLGETLYFAIRDKQPRGYTLTRDNHNTSTGEVSDNFEPINDIDVGQKLNYRAAGLDTPYNDEYTGTVRIKEPLLGGHIRLRYLERYGEDRFASVSCAQSPVVRQCSELTNDGHSFYRSASAEYTKFWHNLSTPFYLTGAAITGSVTWSEQNTSRNTYLDDYDGDIYILYNGQSYTPLTFTEVTGNLDIPIRIGATFTTSWWDDWLQVSLSAGYNLGYEGVYDTGRSEVFEGIAHDVWEDRTFDPALMLDLYGTLNVSQHAAIEFQVNNLTNTAGNLITTDNNPWLRGRSYWVGSVVRF
jgi:hypothetical protein